MVGRTYLERGEPVVVVARWGGDGPRNVLVRRADGRLVVRPFRGLRRQPEIVADSNYVPSNGSVTRRRRR